MANDTDKHSQIDTTRLVQEIEEFPEVYGAQARKTVELANALNEIKWAKENVEATVYLTCRKSAAISGEKTSEKSLKSAIQRDANYQMTCSKLMEIEAQLEEAKTELKILDKKERSLELLGRIHIKEYGNVQRYS